MAAWILIWFVVSLVVGGALIAISIGLARRLVLLGRTLRRFQDDVQPLAEEISRESTRASERGSSIGQRVPPAQS